MVENDVCMVNKRMILFAKRFRSKAPSAASLSPIQLADRRKVGFDFLPTPYCDTVSQGRGMGERIYVQIPGMGFPQYLHLPAFTLISPTIYPVLWMTIFLHFGQKVFSAS